MPSAPVSETIEACHRFSRQSSWTKRFGDLTAVSELSFDVAAGSVTGFLGPNGAGKTTTMRMLLGLAEPTKGRALVFGRPFAELVHPARVGAVLEAADLHPGTHRARSPADAGSARAPAADPWTTCSSWST